MPLAQLAACIPPARAGKRKSVATLWRWATRGLARDGDRVRLEAVRVGGTLMSSVPAYERFVARCSEGLERDAPRSPAERSRASEDAARRLETLGI